MLLATHSGPFHADDVFACALLRCFLDPKLEVLRTRDLDAIAKADVVIDVGGIHDPAQRRFDHHQREYEGELSSAGMVLDWLHAEGKIEDELHARLRGKWVNYIDAVDNGLREPADDVPCFSSIVGAFSEQADAGDAFDRCYEQAVQFTMAILNGLRQELSREEAGRAAVAEAMERAKAEGSRVMTFDRYYKWKRAYFDLGGEEHPTDYLMLPEGGAWRIFAIPPRFGSFENKRPLPAAWGGLVDEELSKVVGVEGARFCHKKLFIAVFATRESAEQAIAKWGLASTA